MLRDKINCSVIVAVITIVLVEMFSFEVITVAKALRSAGLGGRPEGDLADPEELVKTYTATQRRKYLLIIKLHVDVRKTLLRLSELKGSQGVGEPVSCPKLTLSGALSTCEIFAYPFSPRSESSAQENQEEIGRAHV